MLFEFVNLIIQAVTGGYCQRLGILCSPLEPLQTAIEKIKSYSSARIDNDSFLTSTPLSLLIFIT